MTLIPDKLMSLLSGSTETAVSSEREVRCSDSMLSVNGISLNSFLCCVYTIFPLDTAAPLARNVACRGILVILFVVLQYP